MGLFSWDCEGCGHSLLKPDSTDYGVNAWMTNTVAVLKSGKIVEGFYDGYGRLTPNRREAIEFDKTNAVSINPDTRDSSPTVYHRACWELLGQPDAYKGPSQSSDDQGHFFAANAHRFYKPSSVARMEAMRPHPATPPADAPTFEVRNYHDGSNGPCRCCEGKPKACPFCEGACEDCDGTGFDSYGCELCWDRIDSERGPAVVCVACHEAVCEGHKAFPGAWGADEWKAAHVHECKGPWEMPWKKEAK